MENSNTNERQATQLDPGWRNNHPNSRQATKQDPGWRDNFSNGRQATKQDPGWRDNDSNGHQATQIDPDWRKEIVGVFDSTNMLNKSTANYFSRIDDFKDAVEKITELKTSKDKVYSVKRTISKSGGESIILLCADPEGQDSVAKVYYEPINEADSSISSREHVLEYMGTEDGKKYTLAVTEIGYVEFGESKYYFEIMPFCESMDLSDDGAYSFEQLVEITKQLNEALKSIHKAGIIHLDIKPQNLYCIDGKYKLGDFGIARKVDRGPHYSRHIMGTDGYRAPEATRYIYTPANDYYSLGVTLASLFEGHYIFDYVDEEMQAKAEYNETLPLTKTDPNREYIENLLYGLLKIDYHQRFGYEDVNSWLEDHNYTGGGREDKWRTPFTLLYQDANGCICTEKYYDEKSMFFGITKDEKHWNAAGVMLYNKTIANFFSSFRTDLSSYAHGIADDQKYRVQNPNKGLAVFLKRLYSPGPIVWRGKTFRSLSELGSKMIATKKIGATYIEMLQSQCISDWVTNTEEIKVDDNTIKLVESIEELSTTKGDLACYWFGNSFAEERKLVICNKNVSTIDELIKALFSSPNDFYQTDGYHKLFYNGPDFYGFLFSLGYKEIIDIYWGKIKSCQKDEFEATVMLMSMLYTIANKAKADKKIIRDFFTDYGPIGMATYTQKLVKEGVYERLDNNGERILNSIKDFYVPEEFSIENLDTLFEKYKPLLESVDNLRNNLVDNPYLIQTGAYNKVGIICKNLKGCFAFYIFGQNAPLGFNAWIEKTEL